jgi:hypothetical protein
MYREANKRRKQEMSEKKMGLMKFTVFFYDNFCTLRNFVSPLRGTKSFSFGFQTDKSKIYNFDELTSTINKPETCVKTS